MKENRLCRIPSCIFFVLIGWMHCAGQRVEEGPLDPLSYGVVLDHPDMKQVVVKKDISYLEDSAGSLTFDLYLPPGLEPGEKRPAIIFLNAIGENPGAPKVKSWGIYTSWPKLIAANGYIGISMETNGAAIQHSIESLFLYLVRNAARLHVNKDKLGVYAASANVTGAFQYLMGEKACKGIHAAVLYYGSANAGPFRKDLPVFFLISEGDVSHNDYTPLWKEVLKNNAPWTIRMGTGMPHAFDAYADNDSARKLIKETIAFWKSELDPVPQTTFPHYLLRDIYGSLRIDPDKSLAMLKPVVDKHPGEIKYRQFYAAVLKNNEKLTEAREQYIELLKTESQNVNLLVSMADLCVKENHLEDAVTYIRKAEGTGKMTANNYGDLGYLFLTSGHNKEAALYYEKSVTLRPNGHDYYNLACAYAKNGDKEPALSALEKSIAIGFASRDFIEHDQDLDSLKNEERFKQILSAVR